MLALCALLLLFATKAHAGRRGEEESQPPSVREGLLYDPLAPVVKTEFSVILLARDTDCYYHYVPKYAVMQFQFRVSGFYSSVLGPHGFHKQIQFFSGHNSTGDNGKKCSLNYNFITKSRTNISRTFQNDRRNARHSCPGVR